MARIRTIKPEFFRHEQLFELEQASGFPIRVAFAGLWTAADREGRFKWIPRTLKLDCLPFDGIDFSRVLDALESRGFIQKYEVNGVIYGCIPSWDAHQSINNKELASILPSPHESSLSTREPRVNHANATPLNLDQGERKGKEGKGRERKGKVTATATRPEPDHEVPAKSTKTFDAYANAYRGRYRCDPLRNKRVNSQLCQLVDRVGAENAPSLAAYYVSHNKAIYAGRRHSVDLLLHDCEALFTDMQTGQQSTNTAALMGDRTQTNASVFGELIAEARARELEIAQ